MVGLYGPHHRPLRLGVLYADCSNKVPGISVLINVCGRLPGVFQVQLAACFLEAVHFEQRLTDCTIVVQLVQPYSALIIGV